ncbi:NlpC/P60 family protein [Lactobacillus sp. ESL0791]|uniref:C40 family peptidase n=1 Tax=Lactobacillus sp. ESL0791 TaxID=2983234 RepID=UPI0023F747D4|nr:NlpC/P60 family protein [Lactobacillus sp. ESL0791]MDF7639732.1 NlpC/P60 family protein [Lactobacillus sp. ESL0791]
MKSKFKHGIICALIFSAATIALATTSKADELPPDNSTPDTNTVVNNKQNQDTDTNKQEPAHKKKTIYYKGKGTGVIYQTHYGFGKKPGKKNHSAKVWANKPIAFSKIAKNKHGIFVKTQNGWLNKKAFNQFLLTKSKMNYKMKIVHSDSLYSKPAATNGAKKIATVGKLNLLNHWVHVNAAANTNLHQVYYRFNVNNSNYWILAKNLKFNLKALKGNNKNLEHIITTGEKMIGHSTYNEYTRHFDCSSFMNYLFTKSGHCLGSTTFSQCYNGRGVSYRHKKRGDLIFFDDRSGGHLAHVGMYLGKGLFLHDSPYTATGGVCVSSLQDAFWNSSSKKYGSVHHPDGIIRRIL